MKQEVADKFVAALRSGKYSQITGELAHLDKDGKPFAYCVMGVLCDLAREDGVFAWTETTLWDMVAPDEVLEWAELNEDVQAALIELNDEYELSFAEFANLIEGCYNNILLQDSLNVKRGELDILHDAEEDDFWPDDENSVDAP